MLHPLSILGYVWLLFTVTTHIVQAERDMLTTGHADDLSIPAILIGCTMIICGVLLSRKSLKT